VSGEGVLFDRVALVGVGLVNGSLGLALKRRGLVRELVGCARRQATLDKALERGICDRATTDPAAAVEGAGLVVLGVPVLACGPVAGAMAPGLSEDAIVTDVASVKARVVRDVVPKLREPARFVPGHPVAGTEHSGPEAAFAELFEGRWCILTPIEDTDPEATKRVAELWRRVGSKVERMTPEHHDKVLAITSHLPHLIAYTIVATADDLATVNKTEVFKYAAGGFRDFTRIAASDPVMWRDVFLSNQDAVLEMLGRFTEDLVALQRAIRWGEGQTLEDLFTRTRAIRRGVVEAGPRPDGGRQAGPGLCGAHDHRTFEFGSTRTLSFQPGSATGTLRCFGGDGFSTSGTERHNAPSAMRGTRAQDHAHLPVRRTTCQHQRLSPPWGRAKRFPVAVPRPACSLCGPSLTDGLPVPSVSPVWSPPSRRLRFHLSCVCRPLRLPRLGAGTPMASTPSSEFTLSAEDEKKVDELLTRYPTKRAAALPLLHMCQAQAGWIRPEIIEYVAKRLELDTSEVQGIVTFYTLYHKEQVAPNVIWVCRTLSCELRGARAIQQHLEKKLGCHVGGTSKDGKFTLLKAECLAACGQAPMIQLNDAFFENLTTEQVDEILDRVRAGDLVTHRVQQVHSTKPPPPLNWSGDALPDPAVPSRSGGASHSDGSSQNGRGE
jgi:cyclohexadieny/prephenate dehydrogenase